jgi:hypothetical protein
LLLLLLEELLALVRELRLAVEQGSEVALKLSEFFLHFSQALLRHGDRRRMEAFLSHM